MSINSDISQRQPTFIQSEGLKRNWFVGRRHPRRYPNVQGVRPFQSGALSRRGAHHFADHSDAILAIHALGATRFQMHPGVAIFRFVHKPIRSDPIAPREIEKRIRSSIQND